MLFCAKKKEKNYIGPLHYVDNYCGLYVNSEVIQLKSVISKIMEYNNNNFLPFFVLCPTPK